MSAECYPIATLPHSTRLLRDYLAMGDAGASSPVRAWYGAEPLGRAWMGTSAAGADAGALADALERQSLAFGAGPATLANIAKLRSGARVVVTGQQVGLLGGPLLTLLKAATAVARAKQATAATGVEHVPIFWLATADHDLEEATSRKWRRATSGWSASTAIRRLSASRWRSCGSATKWNGPKCVSLRTGAWPVIRRRSMPG